ncbi:response regulator [Streptomyces sp. B-S-A8]|uniref:Transcriptional regulatory protein n=1 Tax=Streptomyces solicavernae TaxID=3043614 RepID=A0ABT6RPI8_9ACTN|nr:response regulator [Streptomyces sp. B-S-A8]MDI3386345.1 response regulator [Streptomyces sp. B-S-A8]
MSGSGGINVLVVDDDVRVAGVNAAYVAKVPGFHVAGQAHTGGDALRLVEESASGGTAIDLVLLDHYLPDRTGLEFVRLLRERGHQTDVIMVTAARDVATVQAAMRHGALQYLVKPFTFAGLRAKLEAYAGLRRTLDSGGEAEQAEVDRIFGALSATPEPELPKGHSPSTAELVRRAMMAAEGPLSAQELADRTGLSRQTAQRYLKLLERSGRVRLSLKYGDTGRPEHRYAWARSGSSGD